jgi:hypothetical protein
LTFPAISFIEMSGDSWLKKVAELVEFDEEETEEQKEKKEDNKENDKWLCTLEIISRSVLSVKRFSHDHESNWNNPFIAIVSPPPEGQFS